MFVTQNYCKLDGHLLHSATSMHRNKYIYILFTSNRDILSAYFHPLMIGSDDPLRHNESWMSGHLSVEDRDRSSHKNILSKVCVLKRVCNVWCDCDWKPKCRTQGWLLLLSEYNIIYFKVKWMPVCLP